VLQIQSNVASFAYSQLRMASLVHVYFDWLFNKAVSNDTTQCRR
jgi:hypothetical protein